MKLVGHTLLWQCPFCCGILARDSDFQLWQDGKKFFAICNEPDCAMTVPLTVVHFTQSIEEKIATAREEMCRLHHSGELLKLREKKRQRNLAEKTVAEEFRDLLLSSRHGFYLPS